MKESPLTLEDLTEAEDSKVCDLQRLVYPDHPIYGDETRAREFWRWWFRESPGSRSRVFGARQRESIVGVRPVSFLPVCVDGREESCAYFNATVTHPDNRRQGIFSRTLVHALDTIERDEGVRFALSFPNTQSVGLHLKEPRLAALGDFALYLKVFRPAVGRALLHPLQFLRHVRASPGIAIEETAGFDERFDRFWAQVKGQRKIWFPRTSRYLDWRYRRSPLGEYTVLTAQDEVSREIAGYVVTKTERRFGRHLGLIVDLVVPDSGADVAAALVRAGLERLQARGVQAAGCLMLPGKTLAGALRASGMFRVPASLAPRRFHVTVACLADDDDLRDAVRNPDSWHLMWADTDNV